MAKLTKSLLSAAIIAATATQAPIVLAADEATFSASTRTFYFHRDPHDGAEDRVALTQALRLDFESAQLADRFSFGASLFANMKLDGHGNDAGTGLLHVDSNGDTESYARIGQAYVNVALTENSQLRAGHMVLGTPILHDLDNRATPSSTQAIMLEANLGGADVYAVYSDRAAGRTGTSYNKYTAMGEDYDVIVVGGGYSFDNGLGVHAAYGVADDYQKQLYLNVSHTYEMSDNNSLLIDLYHYDGEADGNLYSNSAYNATLTNLAARYSMGDMAFTASFQTVGGDNAYDISWGGNDTTLYNTWNSVQYNDFNRKDEDSWQLRADYKVASVPGLKGFVRHVEGEYDNGGGNDVDEAESNLDISYAVQDGSLKGLNMRLRYAHITADADEDIDELRLIGNYSF